MERNDSISSLVEVDIDGEMGNFAQSPKRPTQSDRPAIGAFWLFLWNAVLPVAVAALTTANAVIVNGNGTFIPWFDDGHNLGLLHACMFVVILAIWALVTTMHRRARAKGYLSFYRNTRSIKDTPLLAVGVGNGTFSNVHHVFRPFNAVTCCRLCRIVRVCWMRDQLSYWFYRG